MLPKGIQLSRIGAGLHHDGDVVHAASAQSVAQGRDTFEVAGVVAGEEVVVVKDEHPRAARAAKLGLAAPIERRARPSVRPALAGRPDQGFSLTARERHLSAQNSPRLCGLSSTRLRVAGEFHRHHGARARRAVDVEPAAVAFDAVSAGKAREMDVVIVDTAGRLPTQLHLMEELKKVNRVVGKALPGAPHQVWLVLDATTGQNALQQARSFKEAVQVSGVILSKLDSSARGGMAFAIQRELGLPILFAGLGEKPEDLQPFDPDAFVDGILSNA